MPSARGAIGICPALISILRPGTDVPMQEGFHTFIHQMACFQPHTEAKAYVKPVFIAAVFIVQDPFIMQNLKTSRIE